MRLAWWCGLENGLGPDLDKNTMTHRHSYNEQCVLRAFRFPPAYYICHLHMNKQACLISLSFHGIFMAHIR